MIRSLLIFAFMVLCVIPSFAQDKKPKAPKPEKPAVIAISAEDEKALLQLLSEKRAAYLTAQLAAKDFEKTAAQYDRGVFEIMAATGVDSRKYEVTAGEDGHLIFKLKDQPGEKQEKKEE